MRTLFILLFFAALVFSCDTEKEACVVVPDAKDIPVDVKIEALHNEIANIKTKHELVQLFTREPLIRDYIFRRTEYPDDSVFIKEIFSRVTNPHFDTLLSETNRVFADLTGLENEFEAAFRNIKYNFPQFNIPKIKTVVSGLDTDMLVTDSLIIVGLDFYLGKGAKYRPAMYEYLLRKYDREDIVPTTVLIYGISDRFNKTDMRDKTVLADMVAYGKSFYFAKRMLPCTPDSVLISYTPEEIKGSKKNQDLIWARLIESQVLYSTSHVVKKDYLGERPATIQVGEKCPGRIGQWVGWQIVEKYMATHPDVTLKQLMGSADAQQLFKESRYKPERR
jgi:gliding motility-associated lipoprotein GldB